VTGLLKNWRIVIEDSRPSFVALADANQGNYGPLVALITQAIYGVEFISGSWPTA
jgi:hypothetical protein